MNINERAQPEEKKIVSDEFKSDFEFIVTQLFSKIEKDKFNAENITFSYEEERFLAAYKESGSYGKKEWSENTTKSTDWEPSEKVHFKNVDEEVNLFLVAGPPELYNISVFRACSSCDNCCHEKNCDNFSNCEELFSDQGATIIVDTDVISSIEEVVNDENKLIELIKELNNPTFEDLEDADYICDSYYDSDDPVWGYGLAESVIKEFSENPDYSVDEESVKMCSYAKELLPSYSKIDYIESTEKVEELMDAYVSTKIIEGTEYDFIAEHYVEICYRIQSFFEASRE